VPDRLIAKRQLLDKIEGRKASVAVVGLGYVGLPLAVASAVARQAATGAANATRNILRRIGTR